MIVQGAGGGASGQEVGEREGQVEPSATSEPSTSLFVIFITLSTITTLRVKLYGTSHAEIIVFAF